MRVAVYYRNRDVRVEERPVPSIGPGEILVKVLPAASAEATSWSGTVSARPPRPGA
jgi:NADPH:quinone reductase-like Zn-dependent oxidoreductase